MSAIRDIGVFFCGIGFCMAFTNLYFNFVLNQLGPFPPISVIFVTFGLGMMFMEVKE